MKNNILRVSVFLERVESLLKIHYLYRTTDDSNPLRKKFLVELEVPEDADMLNLYFQINNLNRLSKYSDTWIPEYRGWPLDESQKVIDDNAWIDIIEKIAPTVKAGIEYLGMGYRSQAIGEVLHIVSASLYWYATQGTILGSNEINLNGLCLDK